MRVSGLPPLYEPDGVDAMSATTFSSPSQKKIRSSADWVDRELVFYEDHYTPMEPQRCSFITFNVAEKKPSLGELAFVTKSINGTNPSRSSKPSIICIGLQEVDMSASALMKEETEAAIPWVQALREIVGADHERTAERNIYYPLAVKQLVGMLLCVFIKKDLLRRISQVSVAQIATGTLGGGNKGAVGLRFRLNRSTVCLINCHLAAHQEKVAKRNADIDEILRDMSFQIAPTSSMPTGMVTYPREHDVIVVVGDLNYRVNMSYDQAVPLAQANHHAALLKSDQLAIEMKDAHSPWNGFEDALPTWPPTYRFDKGTSDYDTSEKRRIPAYTDRVLFWARDQRHRAFEILEKHSAHSVILSDHKPVRVLAHIPIRTLDREACNRTRRELEAQVTDLGLDRVMSARTAVKITQLDFGETMYNFEVRKDIEIENIGNCVAEVAILRQHENDPSKASWLRVEPLNFRLFPKEKKTVAVYCRVDKHALEWLAHIHPFEAHPQKNKGGLFELSSFLMFLVRNGMMHFVECQTLLKPSCFGSSLANLIRMGNTPCALAYLPPLNAEEEAIRQQLRLEPRPQIPKELWYLCDYLCGSDAVDTPDLFVEEGEANELSIVAKKLDNIEAPLTATELNVSNYAVAQALVVFLRDLQEPIVPRSLYFAALAAGRQGGKSPLTFVNQLPVLQCNLLIYVISFFRYLLRPQFASRNQLSEDIVAPLLANIFFHHESVPLGGEEGSGAVGFEGSLFSATGITGGGSGGGSSSGGSPGLGLGGSSSPPGAGGSGSTPTTGAGGSTSGERASHVDPVTPQHSSPKLLDLRAELAARRSDAVSFISSLLEED